MSTVTSGSLPDIPEDLSVGSSVSTEFEKEYEEILQHAIVAPRFKIGENVYKKDIEPFFIQQQLDPDHQDDDDADGEETEETLETSDSTPSTVQEDYKTIRSITEAKESVNTGSKAMKKLKQLRFQVPSSALDSLLDYNTPAKSAHNSTNMNNSTDSTESTPEVNQNSFSPPSVDKDLLKMDSLMDEWTLQLKRNVLAELADMKRRQFQYTEETINQMNLKNGGSSTFVTIHGKKTRFKTLTSNFRYNAESLKLQHEIDSLKELLYSFEQSLKQKDEVIKNLTDALNKQKGRSDKIRLFSMWRLKHNDEQRQEFSTKMAEKFYTRTLLMKVWAGWRSVVESRWKQRVEKACQVKSQEICLKLTEDYEERLQALQKELASTRTEVAKMHTERDCYEENMKKAFMRGVCALNMEAMSMFHEGKNEEMPSDSANHYPCNGPGVPTTTNGYYGTNHVSQQQQQQQQAQQKTYQPSENQRKQVQFNDSCPTSTSNVNNTSSNKKTLVPSTRPNNATSKNINVKVSAKKDFGTHRKAGPGNQSTISSIKVERHVPTGQHTNNSGRTNLPQYPKDTTGDQFPLKRSTSRVPTVKVVE